MKNDPLRQQTILEITSRLVDIWTPSGSLENCPDMKERVVRFISLLRSAMYPHVFGTSSRQTSGTSIAVSYNLQRAAELLEQLLSSIRPGHCIIPIPSLITSSGRSGRRRWRAVTASAALTIW